MSARRRVHRASTSGVPCFTRTEHACTCELDAAPDTVIENVPPAGTSAAPATVTKYALTAAYAAPDTVIEHVAPAASSR